MYLIAQCSTQVACSATDAFNLVANMERFAEWFPAVIEIRASDALAPGQVGKQYRETVHIPLRGQRQIVLTVKEAIAGQLFVTEGRLTPLLPRMEVRFQAVTAEQTRIDWRMLSRSQSTWVRYLMLPLARRVMQRRAERALGNLQQLLAAPRVKQDEGAAQLVD